MYINDTNGKFTLGKREIIHILIAWIGITLAFSWRGFNFSAMLDILPVILIGTLTGFIVHELAHKFTAIHYGAFAEFIMWPIGLIFAVVMALVTAGGFVFAAPGAVYIYGRNINVKQNGIISLAGPLANLAIATIFIGVAFIVSSEAIRFILINAAFINVFLGGFNMIPIPPLDGSKVFVWNKGIWFGFTIIFIALFWWLGGF